ncbi:MAG: hypothetical protein Q7K43_06695 [Candidatus Woesearchaeota archaeon]|nr:hypothetical protein [Candidatus Woesearchaeota archaeon]
MSLSKVETYILFVLGLCERELHKRMQGKPLEITLSKSAFIELIMHSGVAGKKERALYRNLESLEKRKLLKYDHSIINLTERGEKQFSLIAKTIDPFIRVRDVLSSTDLLKSTKKARAILVAE